MLLYGRKHNCSTRGEKRLRRIETKSNKLTARTFFAHEEVPTLFARGDLHVTHAGVSVIVRGADCIYRR